MPNTYSKLYIHVVFAVKRRANLIHPKLKEDLFKYICGIVNNNEEKVYAINSMPDHIHILLSIKPNCLLSDLVRDIKRSTSKWINENKLIISKFQWQEGFGAFSVSYSDVNRVILYIENQEIHHQKKSFKQEYLEFLDSYNIKYEEKYALESVD